MSWPLMKLKECCDIVGGATPKRNIGEYWDSNDVPWITPKDISNLGQPLLDDAPEYISVKGFKSCATYMLPKGSVLLTSRAPIGNVAIAGRAMCTNQGFKSLVPNENLDSTYLYYCILAHSKRLQALGNGATFKEVSKKIVEEFEIPIPPLPEQKRIAAILDKADSLRRKNQQAIQLADKFLRAVFLDLFGDPVTNPKGWEIKKLKDISLIQIGPFGTQLHKEDYIEGGIPLINPTHIVNGKIVPNTGLSVTKSKHAELGEYHLKVGDIIMARRGEMGRCAIVSKHEENWLCGTGSLYIRPQLTGIFSEYLCTLLSGKAIKNYLEAESQGATMANLNKSIVGNINIPMPSEEKLNAFSNIREKALRNIQKINLCPYRLIFNALSQKAFAGKL